MGLARGWLGLGVNVMKPLTMLSRRRSASGSLMVTWQQQGQHT
jgi:hypothetical protein